MIGRPVDLFSQAVRAGRGPLNTPERVLTGMLGYLRAYQRSNLLPYAPGGGIENAGISQAVVDMLLSSSATPSTPGAEPPVGMGAWVLSLFPFWPASEPASFSNLVAKGAWGVSAAFDNATQAVISPVTVQAVSPEPSGSGSTRRLSLRLPWTSAQPSEVSATCGGISTPLVWTNWTMIGQPVTVLSLDIPAVQPPSVPITCLIALTVAAH